MKMKQQIEAYLDGKLSSTEKVQFLGRIGADVEVDEWFREGIENAQDILPADAKERLLGRICPSEPRRCTSACRRWSAARWGIAASVMVVLMIAAGLTGYMLHRSKVFMPADQIVCIRTGVGERSTATLPDGTIVSLNAMTTVTYDCAMRGGERRVNLEGEAYFDVAKDSEHPFIIDVNHMEVTCLGTALNVRNYTDEQMSSVVLVNGKVRVTTDSGDLTMEPDSRVECDKASLQMSKSRVVAGNYTCWLNGEIRYNDQTLEEIVAELSRNYHVQMVITSDKLRKERFTGYLGHCSLRNVLDLLSLTSNINYYVDNDTVVYVYAKN